MDCHEIEGIHMHYIINNYNFIYINIFLSEETEDTDAKL